MILLTVNLAIWGLFGYLVLCRRWTKASLAVAILHLLLITPMSIAPLRALTEPETFNLGLAWLQVPGAWAAIPALIIWTWGLAAAVIALTRPYGGVLRLIVAGDLTLAANFGTFFTFMMLQDAIRSLRMQAGEFLTLSGVVPAILLMVLLVVPFTFSAWWALRQARMSGPSSSLPSDSASQVGKQEDVPDDGLRCDSGLLVVFDSEI
jgi:hypothetical protein